MKDQLEIEKHKDLLVKDTRFEVKINKYLREELKERLREHKISSEDFCSIFIYRFLEGDINIDRMLKIFVPYLKQAKKFDNEQIEKPQITEEQKEIEDIKSAIRNYLKDFDVDR